MLFRSKWMPDRKPALSALAFIHRFGGANLHNQQVTAQVIFATWMRCPKERLARDMIAGILNGIGRTIAGPSIARLIYRMPFPKIQGRPLIKASRLRRALRAWRCNGQAQEQR